jgi:restriction endonuclease S subunit
MVYIFNVGYTLIDKKYPGLPLFLSSSFYVELEDQSHRTTEYPIPLEEQHAILTEFEKTNQSAAIDALLKEMKEHGSTMKPNFSHAKHYEAFWYSKRISKSDGIPSVFNMSWLLSMRFQFN